MEKVQLKDIRFSNQYSAANANKYMLKVRTYKGFDPNMEFKVYANSNREFIIAEATNWRINFMCNSHKVEEILLTHYDPIECTFSEFIGWVSREVARFDALNH